MLTIYDDATLDGALNILAPSAIRDTLTKIAHDAKASDLWPTLTCALVVQNGDRVADLQEALGFDPLTGPLYEAGETFEPYWSWLENHGDHYEMLITASDEGFAFFVLIAIDSGLPLARLLSAYRPSTG